MWRLQWGGYIWGHLADQPEVIDLVQTQGRASPAFLLPLCGSHSGMKGLYKVFSFIVSTELSVDTIVLTQVHVL